MDAREYFEDISSSVARIGELRALIRHGCFAGGRAIDAPRPRCPRGDSTASAAARLDGMRRELAALEQARRDARVVLDGVRWGLGGKFADALEARFLDPPSGSHRPAPYARVAARLGVCCNSAARYVNVALDWLDMEGFARVREWGAEARRSRQHGPISCHAGQLPA